MLTARRPLTVAGRSFAAGEPVALAGVAPELVGALLRRGALSVGDDLAGRQLGHALGALRPGELRAMVAALVAVETPVAEAVVPAASDQPERVSKSKPPSRASSLARSERRRRQRARERAQDAAPGV